MTQVVFPQRKYLNNLATCFLFLLISKIKYTIELLNKNIILQQNKMNLYPKPMFVLFISSEVSYQVIRFYCKLLSIINIWNSYAPTTKLGKSYSPKPLFLGSNSVQLSR